jgi:hypothetical protein
MNRFENLLLSLGIAAFIGLIIAMIVLNYNYEKNYVATNDCHLTGNTKTEEYSYWVTTDSTTGAGFVDYGEYTTYEYYCNVTGSNKWFMYRFYD